MVLSGHREGGRRVREGGRAEEGISFQIPGDISPVWNFMSIT